MKLFGWVQNKLGGRQGNEKPNAVSANCAKIDTAKFVCYEDHLKQEPKKDHLDHLPRELLSIGTLGNNDHTTRDPKIQDQSESHCPSPDLSDFTPEEVGQLQKVLTKLLKREQPAVKQKDETNPQALPLNRFLNCPSSLEIGRRISNAVCSDLEDDIERTINVIIGKCKEVRAEKKKKNKEAIQKKTFSFLLKKAFTFASGFSPAPSFRDPLLEPRMEKLLRAILCQKVYQQSSTSKSTTKRCIKDNKQTSGDNNEDPEEKARASLGSNWVKTDTEYIVLEI
ncbi:hypothetical protein Dimus_027450 [Dionaea muscipula]